MFGLIKKKNKTENEENIKNCKISIEEVNADTAVSENKKSIGMAILTSWTIRCLIIAFFLEFLLEVFGRRSFIKAYDFMLDSPIVFFYNINIIFFTLLFALLPKRRIFGVLVISMLWIIMGFVNFVVLGFRVTPFAAIDFLMVKDTFSMRNVYFKPWQQALIVVGVVLIILLFVYLFRKLPKYEGRRHIKSLMCLCIIMWAVVMGFTNFAVKHNIISDDFANLHEAYTDYGFAYCFTNSIIDNGIEKPNEYNEDTVLALKRVLDNEKVIGESKTPNIIIIQLESFFDPNYIEGFSYDRNPVEAFEKFKDKYPSGYLTVPAYGTGTANSEFEVLTGIKSSYFGAGEYPYKTTLNSVPCIGLCSTLMNNGYNTFAIHNNTCSFYDRQNVYNYMGFERFISIEYMYDYRRTSTGWVKDDVLVPNIIDCLEMTPGKDFVFTISLQGHGRYPVEENSCKTHVNITYDENITGELDDDYKNMAHYYINQLYEMDKMISSLVHKLDDLGEDYVLVLYGDHLPTLPIDESQLPNQTVFQTEYIIINNIGLKLDDESIAANELSTKLLHALNIEGDYINKCHDLYSGEELDDNIKLLSYDLLYGDSYLFGGASPVYYDRMQMGIREIAIDHVKVVNDDHTVVYGKNFNEFSKVYINGKKANTTYIDEFMLLLDDDLVDYEDEIDVRQIDESGHELSKTEAYIYLGN